MRRPGGGDRGDRCGGDRYRRADRTEARHWDSTRRQVNRDLAGRAPARWRRRLYGSPAELPNIYHSKEYEAGLDRLPDYRLTCFFVDRDYRRTGVAAVALSGALELIAQAGGGVVEAYPHDIADQKVSASFLYNGTRSMFERAGFRYDRPKGTKNCVMSITVAAVSSASGQ